MTTVLITGAAGFLGSHCVEYWLEKTDWKIIAVDSFKHRGKLERLPDSRHHRVAIVGLDLSTPAAVSALKKWTPDIIVNAASDSHVDRSISNPAATWFNNTSLTFSVLEFARECQPKLFVQTSTDEVYGPVDGKNFGEWATILPSNPYAASKAAQEALAISYWRTYGVPVAITNCVNMFGERQHPEKFLPKIVQRLLANEMIEVHADANGQVGSRCWTHAKNYADLVMFLAEREPAMYPRSSRPDRWHIAGQGEIDNLQVVTRVASILGVRSRYAIVDAHTARPGHDAHYGLDGSALTCAGWVYPFKLHESLESTVKWYAANPGWLQTS